MPRRVAIALLLTALSSCESGPTVTVEPGTLTIGSDRTFLYMPVNTERDGENHVTAIAVPSGLSTSAVARIVADGDTVAYGGAVTWTSSAPGIISVDGSGALTAHAVGTATLSAAAPGFPETSIEIVAVNGYTATSLAFSGTALSDAGSVVGRSDSAAVLWQSGATTDLGDWYPEDVNSAGTVVGTLGPRTASVPVVWMDGALSELDIDGCAWGEARVINDAGTVGGWVWCDGEQPPIRTRRWTAAGMDSIGDGFPEDIAASGTMVGWEGPSPRLWSGSQQGVRHPNRETLWYDDYRLTGLTDAGATIGFVTGGGAVRHSYGIFTSSAGVVSFHDGSPWCNYLADERPVMWFDAINNDGIIVGRSSAALCDAPRDAYDGIVLHSAAPPVPIRLLTEASLTTGTLDINNVGQILAVDHVLTPIPF